MEWVLPSVAQTDDVGRTGPKRSLPMTLSIIPVHGIPEVRLKADLVGLVLAAVASAGNKLVDGDVLVVAQKVVSKSEGRIVRLGDVVPGKRALEMAEESGKDARQLEVVLGESKQIVRWERGVLIVETRHGFVCANAGVDRSNAGAPDTVVLLPLDPDASAARIRDEAAKGAGRAHSGAAQIPRREAFRRRRLEEPRRFSTPGCDVVSPRRRRHRGQQRPGTHQGPQPRAGSAHEHRCGG